MSAQVQRPISRHRWHFGSTRFRVQDVKKTQYFGLTFFVHVRDPQNSGDNPDISHTQIFLHGDEREPAVQINLCATRSHETDGLACVILLMANSVPLKHVFTVHGTGGRFDPKQAPQPVAIPRSVSVTRTDRCPLAAGWAKCDIVAARRRTVGGNVCGWNGYEHW